MTKQGTLKRLAVAAMAVGALASPEVQAQAPTEALPVAPEQAPQQEKAAIPVKETRKNRNQRRAQGKPVGAGAWELAERPEADTMAGWSKQRRQRERSRRRKAWLAQYAKESAARYESWKIAKQSVK